MNCSWQKIFSPFTQRKLNQSTISPQKHVSTCFFFSCSNQSKHDMKPQKITARNLTLRMVLRFGFRLSTKNSSEPFSCTSRSINHRFSKQNYNNKLMPKGPKKATKRGCETNLRQFASPSHFDSQLICRCYIGKSCRYLNILFGPRTLGKVHGVL